MNIANCENPNTKSATAPAFKFVVIIAPYEFLQLFKFFSKLCACADAILRNTCSDTVAGDNKKLCSSSVFSLFDFESHFDCVNAGSMIKGTHSVSAMPITQLNTSEIITYDKYVEK